MTLMRLPPRLALAVFLSNAGLVFSPVWAQSVNPSVSPTGSVLLAPHSKAGAQSLNPSMSPEARVLLAPPPKGAQAGKGPRSVGPSQAQPGPAVNATVSPAGRVLLAPVPKAAAQRAEAQARERARAQERANRPVSTGASGSGPSASPRAAGASQDYEAQLAAIRAELIAAATRAQVRIKAVSWLDGQGQLHEANEFRSDAKVQGIRISRGAGDSQTRVELDQLQPLSASENCSPKASPFKRHAYFSVRTEPGGGFFSTAQLSALAESLGPELLTLLAADTGWAFSQSPFGAGRSRPDSLYEERLLGRVEDSAPFELSVRLVDMGRRSEEPPARLPDSEPALTPPAWVQRLAVRTGLSPQPPDLGLLGVVLVVSDRSTGLTVFSRSIALPMQQVRTGYLDAPRAVVSDVAQAQRALESLQQGLRTGMGCTVPEYPVLERQAEGRFLLNGGKRLGLAVGSQVLLSAPAQIPSRILQPEVAASLMLAVVESVDQDRALVRRVAGPAPTSSGALVGLPF